MDELRFDAIARSLADPAPRRTAVQRLGGAALTLLAALGAVDVASAAKEKKRRGAGGSEGSGNDGAAGNNTAGKGAGGKTSGNASGGKNGGKGGNTNGKKKRKSQRDKKNHGRGGSSGDHATSGSSGPTGTTGPAGPEEDTGNDDSGETGDVALEAKKKAKPTNLNGLTDVVVTGTPVDGAVLAFVGSRGQWEPSVSARLDFITLTDEDPAVDTSLTIYGPQGPNGGIGANLNISLLDDFRGFIFPNANGVLALTNQYGVFRAVGPQQAVPAGEIGFATAECPEIDGVQTFAMGALMEVLGDPPLNAVSILAQSVDLDEDDKPTIARVAVKATDGDVTFVAGAMCLRLP